MPTPYRLWDPRFWSSYWTTMRPYLMFLSGASALVGISLVEGEVGRTGLVMFGLLFLTYGFGQALTDVFQTDTDALSAPYRPLVQGLVRQRDVALVSTVALLAAATWIGLLDLVALGLAIIAVLGIVAYTWFKRRWWGGPPWNSWVFAMVGVVAWKALAPDISALGTVSFWAAIGTAFFSYANFVLVGYLKDLDADRRTGYHTFPLTFGWRANTWLTDAVLVLATGCAGWVVFTEPLGVGSVAFLLLAVATGAAAQVVQHRGEDEENAWIPVAWTVRANLLFPLAVVAANWPALSPWLALYAVLFELSLRARPEQGQI
jgi:4-hydroxybenzoate polyprenyltransferase